MRNRFKFHVQHGSDDQFRKGGVGWLHVEDERLRLELPIQLADQTSLEIRNVRRCDTSKGLTETLRTRTWPAVELNFSRLPVFLACALVLLMCPVPEVLPWEWLFKGIGIVGCFYHLLVVPLVRLLIEFEDSGYVCGEIAGAALDEHHTRILQ